MVPTSKAGSSVRSASSALAILFAATSCTDDPANSTNTAAAQQELGANVTSRSVSFEFAKLDSPFPAGVAAGKRVVFVGSPFDGRVTGLSRATGKSVGELPSPPNGFVLPFILKHVGEHRVAVLDAGGFPSPKPIIPANPTIYEYDYSYSANAGFAATLVRTISFASVLVGFSEDIIHLDDGRYLLADALLGSIWVAELDGTIRPGIVPKTFSPADAIPQLYFCDTMPLIKVGGIPFLFTGSTLPGVAPLAVRDGRVYYHSSCAGGVYTFPLNILTDAREPYQRAADIRLLSPKPADTQVEELLDASFDPYHPDDPFLYAADALQLRLIRIDSRSGTREVVADDPHLLNFPSSLSFLPPLSGFDVGGGALVVVSNQQHLTPITNDAITEDMLQLPFLATEVRLRKND